MEHKSKQILISIIAIVLLVLLAVFLFNNVGPSNNGELTDSERREILEAISSDSGEVNPLSEEERQAILEDLGSESEPNPLSEEERQAILDQISS